MAERIAEEIVIHPHHLRLTAKWWRADDGLPVLALHGWLDNANSFDRLAPLLPQLNLVSLDLPGHGTSAHRPAGMRYHYTDYVDDAMAAADMLGWDRFALLGHSMGAGIGCLAASAYPDRVTRLLLIEGLGPLTEGLNAAPSMLRRSIDAMRPKERKNNASYHDIEVLIRARAAASRLKRDSAELLVRRSIKRKGDVFSWRSDPRLKRPHPQYFSNTVMLAFLSAITAPVLLITAEDGLLRRRSFYQSRCEAIDNLETITLPGHHHLHLDEPAPVANAIQSYFESQEAL